MPGTSEPPDLPRRIRRVRGPGYILAMKPFSLLACAASAAVTSLLSAQYSSGDAGGPKAPTQPPGAQAPAAPTPGPIVNPVPGKSLANASNTAGLRRDVSAGVLSLEKQMGVATGSKLVDTKVATAPKGSTASDLTTASWTEVWTVQNPKGKTSYLVTFTGQGKGKNIKFGIAPQK